MMPSMRFEHERAVAGRGVKPRGDRSVGGIAHGERLACPGPGSDNAGLDRSLPVLVGKETRMSSILVLVLSVGLTVGVAALPVRRRPEDTIRQHDAVGDGALHRMRRSPRARSEACPIS